MKTKVIITATLTLFSLLAHAQKNRPKNIFLSSSRDTSKDALLGRTPDGGANYNRCKVFLARRGLAKETRSEEGHFYLTPNGQIKIKPQTNFSTNRDEERFVTSINPLKRRYYENRRYIVHQDSQRNLQEVHIIDDQGLLEILKFSIRSPSNQCVLETVLHGDDNKEFLNLNKCKEMLRIKPPVFSNKRKSPHCYIGKGTMKAYAGGSVQKPTTRPSDGSMDSLLGLTVASQPLSIRYCARAFLNDRCNELKLFINNSKSLGNFWVLGIGEGRCSLKPGSCKNYRVLMRLFALPSCNIFLNGNFFMRGAMFKKIFSPTLLPSDRPRHSQLSSPKFEDRATAPLYNHVLRIASIVLLAITPKKRMFSPKNLPLSTTLPEQEKNTSGHSGHPWGQCQQEDLQ